MSETPIARPIPAPHTVCQICAREVWARKPKCLFNFIVCSKCRNKFANRRQCAYIIDSILYIIAAFLGIGAVNALLEFVIMPTQRSELVIEIIEYSLGWVAFPFFFSFKDGFSGMSPGKWICGVQVVDRETREPIGFRQSFKRNVWLMIPFVSLVIAIQMMHGPRPGDGYARTHVIWRKYQFKPPFNPLGFACIGCGYDLTGNVSGRCPECGRDFAPPVAAAVA